MMSLIEKIEKDFVNSMREDDVAKEEILYQIIMSQSSKNPSVGYEFVTEDKEVVDVIERIIKNLETLTNIVDGDEPVHGFFSQYIVHIEQLNILKKYLDEWMFV